MMVPFNFVLRLLIGYTVYFLSIFVANSRAAIREGFSLQNISLSGHDIYNFYSNQIVEIVNLPGGKNAFL